MIGNQEQLQYLMHRTGEKQLQSLPQVATKALEGNVAAPDFLKTYGDANITAYVGFIDLAGYSTAVKGKLPQEIADYLRPFLEGTIDVLYNGSALIDKMIGDEIMFILPEIEEINNPNQILSMGQILGGLHDLAYKLETYRYRIGLSYGKVNVFHLTGRGYSEWSVVGEPVHVAKRLHAVGQLSSPNPVCGAFGLSVNAGSLEILKERIKNMLESIAGFASRFDHEIMEETKDFKGVGEVLWAYLSPKGPES